MNNTEITYQDAGVNITAGNELVDYIKQHGQKTTQKNVLKGIGGFAALYELPLSDYEKPILVSSTDGVGTKLKLAIETNRHSSIGIDLVAMCVNDLILCGATPLFFLDYYATGKLNLSISQNIIDGIIAGCEQSEMSLIGGETAEMPGMYHEKDYDLAGFSVGIVDKQKIIDGRHVKPGNVILGLASSGLHSNGFSLVRKLITLNNISLDSKIENTPLIDLLLTPTKIYVKSILALQKQIKVNAMAHITGGGFVENIPRVLPQNCKAIIESNSFTIPPIFEWLQKLANLSNKELYKTFNNGIGLIIIIDEEYKQLAIDCLTACGENVVQIGTIDKREDNHSAIDII